MMGYRGWLWWGYRGGGSRDGGLGVESLGWSWWGYKGWVMGWWASRGEGWLRGGGVRSQGVFVVGWLWWGNKGWI